MTWAWVYPYRAIGQIHVQFYLGSSFLGNLAAVSFGHVRATASTLVGRPPLWRRLTRQYNTFACVMCSGTRLTRQYNTSACVTCCGAYCASQVIHAFAWMLVWPPESEAVYQISAPACGCKLLHHRAECLCCFSHPPSLLCSRSWTWV